MSEEQYLLKMTGVSKTFPGVKALDDVHLFLRPGSVHALMGENGAGKSTLMRCLFGVYSKDCGEIELDGRQVSFDTPSQALKHGVSMVNQELEQVLQRNVMENIWLGRFPRKGIMVDESKMYAQTVAIFKELEIDVNPRAKINSLSISMRQMVEIAKAVSYNSRVVVLDEPTSSLTENEVDRLFKIINQLKNKGCGIIYISHKMEEILKIADEVTVMRDGRWVACEKATDLTTDRIISLMVGRDLSSRFPPKDNVPGATVLKVEGLSSFFKPKVMDASFDVRAGEIFGVAGLVGARRTELLETLYGVRKRACGVIMFKGEHIQINNPRDAIKHGFALVTEERRLTGIFEMLSVSFNMIIANLKAYKSRLGVLNLKKVKSDNQKITDSLQVKTPSFKTLIRSLSGGNQQKVILGRWLLTEPEVLLLDEPTRGIDVGAKYEIYQLIIDMAKKGKSIIVVSSEMPELFGITDRMLVMSNGRVAGIVNTKDATQEMVLNLAAKYL